MLPGTIAFFGASSIYGAGDLQGGGYVVRFRRWYDEHREKGVVYNLGIPGETSSGLAKRFVREKEVRDPHLVIFQFGANDAHRQFAQDNPSATRIEVFSENVRFLLENGLKHAGVGIIGPYPVNESSNPHGQYKKAKDAYYLNKDISMYADKLRELAGEFRVEYLNLWEDWMAKDRYLTLLHPDGLHANEAGHADIANRVIQFVQQNYSHF